MGPARAEGAEIERGGFQRAVQCRVVELRVMGEGDDSGAGIGPEIVERLIRPIGADDDIGEPFVGSKRPPRIDHGDREPALAANGTSA